VEGNSESVIWIVHYNGMYMLRESSTEQLEVERYSSDFVHQVTFKLWQMI